MTAPSQEPDPFAPGEPRREIVLVALGAVVLGRRAFPARNDADQLLLLLALVDGGTRRHRPREDWGRCLSASNRVCLVRPLRRRGAVGGHSAGPPCSCS